MKLNNFPGSLKAVCFSFVMVKQGFPRNPIDPGANFPKAYISELLLNHIAHHWLASGASGIRFHSSPASGENVLLQGSNQPGSQAGEQGRHPQGADKHISMSRKSWMEALAGKQDCHSSVLERHVVEA